MAPSAPKGWFERNLPGSLVDMLGLYAYGSHAALLQEAREAAKLRLQLAKPPGERSCHLRGWQADFHQMQIWNHEAVARRHAAMASSFEKPTSRMCCAAAGWVRQRLAASYWARYHFERLCVQQIAEELAATLDVREPALVAQPTFSLHLPQALQQLPPRLDMCSACAELIEQADLDEQSHTLMAQHSAEMLESRGLRQAAAGAAASRGRADAAAVAAAPNEGAAQRQRQQAGCGDSSGSSGSGASTPRTPMPNPPPPPQPQQHSSPDFEEDKQEGAACELRKKQPPPQQQHACAAAGEVRAATALYS